MTCPQIVKSDKPPMEIAEFGHDSPVCSLTSIPGEPEVAPLPSPWLFGSEALLRELDRIRETALQVPVNGDSNATHFGLQIVINTVWTLRENIRYMLAIHRERQTAFAKQLKTEQDAQHQTIYDLFSRLLITC